MIAQLRKHPIIMIVSTTLLLTALISLLIYEQVALLHFINISFYFSSACITLGLLFMIVSNGFFDGFTHGFRVLFRRNSRERGFDDNTEIIPLSQLMPIPHSPLLYSGLILLIINLICLFFYYQ
ncbi:DUF3899 domain-containing protein [Bacillus massiliigorillae]|uniref:DUF3899 domain-containing protein n=1 Tax=Bacillus massiliigorillae TaxID=1243664 RepID=UPI00039A5301|nr:DUF3899 domain-containing protein [Bacillus massiliigorillae]